MSRPPVVPIDPEHLPELARQVIQADRFPHHATMDGDQPRLRPVSPVRTDGFVVYVANLKGYHKTAEIAANPKFTPPRILERGTEPLNSSNNNRIIAEKKPLPKRPPGTAPLHPPTAASPATTPLPRPTALPANLPLPNVMLEQGKAVFEKVKQGALETLTKIKAKPPAAPAAPPQAPAAPEPRLKLGTQKLPGGTAPLSPPHKPGTSPPQRK